MLYFKWIDFLGSCSIWVENCLNFNFGSFHILGWAIWRYLHHSWFNFVGKAKFVNMIHNLEDAFLSCDKNVTIQRWSKEEKKWNTVPAPGWLQIYRDTHGYVDYLRNVTSRSHSPFRHSHGWRVWLSGWMEMLSSNAHRYWISVNEQVNWFVYSFNLIARCILWTVYWKSCPTTSI